ncbi:flagellar basal body rod protein FlgB [bacterium]|nr:flagellar basal body rod protein FlgB [bacterium]MBU1983417.1 flagellar basal body rod protein FlgB [bacterium]
MADRNVIQDFLINQSSATTVLKKNLDAQAARQRAHAQNIANAETPGYRRVAVDFESELKEVLDQESSGALRTTNPRHLRSGASSLEEIQPKFRTEPLPEDGNGVNGVDMDQEMAEMAETQLRYLASLELLKRRYTGLKSAIRGQ